MKRRSASTANRTIYEICVRNDYGAGGGNFIGVCAGVDASSGVGETGDCVDVGSAALGAVVGAALAWLCSNDVGDAGDALAWRNLENGISAIRATSIGTTTAAGTARFVQIKIYDAFSITCVWWPSPRSSIRFAPISRRRNSRRSSVAPLV